VVTSSAPDLFETTKNATTGTSPTWVDGQVNAMTREAVLDRVIKELNLAEEWQTTSAAATVKLRDMMEVSREGRRMSLR
jgi:hypothetical protein